MSQDRELSVLWRFLLKFLGFAKAGQGVIMEVLFSISLALVAGLLVSRLVKPLKLPAVTGYLIISSIPMIKAPRMIAPAETNASPQQKGVPIRCLTNGSSIMMTTAYNVVDFAIRI